MVPSVPAKILISIPLDAEVSKELLSWTMRVIARPNDNVVALHVLVSKEPKPNESIAVGKTRFRRAKSFVISMLGEFVEICQSKQVKLEAKVGYSSSIGRGLIEEAKCLGADFLLVAGSRNRSQGSRLEITKYCFKHAPERCSVISIGKCKHPHEDLDSKTLSSEEFQRLSSGSSNNDTHINKATSPFNESKNQNSLHSPEESNSEKASPRAVLNGPEGGSQSIEEDSYSFNAEFQQSSSGSSNNDTHINKATSPFNESKNQNNLHSPEKSNSEKASPRAVLNGPEGGSQSIEEDSYSFNAEFQQSSSGSSNNDTHINKATSPFNESKNQNNLHSPEKSNSEKASPRAVLNGPEGGSQSIEEDSYSSNAEFQQSSSGSPNNDTHINKVTSPFNESKNQNSLHSPAKSNSEKASPRAVLKGPGGGSQSIEEDSYSFEDSSFAESPLVPTVQGRSRVRKHLLTMKLLIPFLGSPFNGMRKGRDKSLSDNYPRPSWRCFSYEEILKATNNFHPDNMVGQGGYSEVFRGDLPDGQTIAVKRLSKKTNRENKEKEFLVELGIIGHVFHPNTSYLIGCCIENGLHLIFNFSPNGNLASALHGKTCKSLVWPVRYKIATGVARGLNYLHKGCKHRIIHRDIKAANVLLGQDFEPQISDFGLAKWLPNQWTHHAVIPIEGTFGYLAPEYFMHGIVDEKTDVFAFGVLLLEIIAGRRPVDSSKQNLLLWSKPLIESGNIAELADPKLEGKYDVEQMQQLVLIASYCIRRSSIWRPSMSEVLELLTDSHDSEASRRWRFPDYMIDEMDDIATSDSIQYLTNQVLQDDDQYFSSLID